MYLSVERFIIFSLSYFHLKDNYVAIILSKIFAYYKHIISFEREKLKVVWSRKLKILIKMEN